MLKGIPYINMECVNKLYLIFIVLLKIVPSYQHYRDCLIDVVFLVEESSLVSAANYNITIKLVKETITNLDLKENGVHIGVSCYSNKYRNIFDLDFYYRQSPMMGKLNGMQRLQNGTQPNIPYALNQSCVNMFVSSAGDRSGAENFVVLLSGSGQNSGTADELDKAVQVCKENSVRIISVDEDIVVSDVVKDIADGPTYHFDFSSSDDSLETVAVAISTLISDNSGCREVYDRLAVMIEFILFCSLALLTLIMCLICFLQNRYLRRTRSTDSEKTSNPGKTSNPEKKAVPEKTSQSKF